MPDLDDDIPLARERIRHLDQPHNSSNKLSGGSVFSLTSRAKFSAHCFLLFSTQVIAQKHLAYLHPVRQGVDLRQRNGVKPIPSALFKERRELIHLMALKPSSGRRRGLEVVDLTASIFLLAFKHFRTLNQLVHFDRWQRQVASRW